MGNFPLHHNLGIGIPLSYKNASKNLLLGNLFALNSATRVSGTPKLKRINNFPEFQVCTSIPSCQKCQESIWTGKRNKKWIQTKLIFFWKHAKILPTDKLLYKKLFYKGFCILVIGLRRLLKYLMYSAKIYMSADSVLLND